MQFNVSASADLPLYRQLMRQITDAIAGGRLAPGEKLKSHRELSEELVIAPLTVKKAYDELETLGYIETQRGRGTFVCEKLPRPNRADQRDRIADTARSLLSQAYLAGLDLPDVIDLLRSTHTELRQTKEKA